MPHTLDGHSTAIGFYDSGLQRFPQNTKVHIRIIISIENENLQKSRSMTKEEHGGRHKRYINTVLWLENLKRKTAW